MNVINLKSAAPTELEPKFDITSVLDGAVHIYVSQITENYVQILRNHVLPNVERLSSLGLRELRVINCIYRFTSGMTSADVVAVLRYDPATVSRAIKRLEGLGLLQRVANIRDARSSIVQLTQSGRELAAEYRGKSLQTYRFLSDVVGGEISEEEVETFLKVAKKLKERTDRMERIRPAMTKKHLSESNDEYKTVLKKTAY